MNGPALKVLLIGIEPTARSQIDEALAHPEVTTIADLAAWEAITSSIEDGIFNLIVCGGERTDISVLEVGQTFRTLCPGTPLFFVSTRAADLQRKDMLKNGYREVYLLPIERSLFAADLAVIAQGRGISSRKIYRGVSLIDVKSKL